VGSLPEGPILNVKSNPSRPLTAMLTLNGKPVPMEVDTGAAVSIMAESTQKELFPQEVPKRAEVRLKTYTTEPLPVVGVIHVKVEYGEYRGTHPLYVVHGKGPTLLGRDWLQTIRLDWKSLGVANIQEQPLSLESLLQKHEEVFHSSVGTMHQFQAKLVVKPEAKPRFHRPRSVPYAMKDAIERELDRLEAEGVVERVSHSDWAAPIVAVPKSDGTVRLCGDYKVTVNPVLDINQYPLPCPEDLMTSLTGGKCFTKLDLSSAYQQMPLEEESKKFVTVNTHRRLYWFTRLPFGIASAHLTLHTYTRTLYM